MDGAWTYDLGRMAGAALIAAEAGVLLCGLVVGLGIVDAPTEARKTQKAPVPTSGGLGFGLASLGAVLALSLLSGEVLSLPVAAACAGAAAALMLGFADDALHLPARLKLVLMLAIVLLMAWGGGVRTEDIALWPGAGATLPVALGVAGSALWLLVLINAVNFMDGANGLAMGMALIAATGLGLCAAIAGRSDLALLCFALAGSLAAFLFWNVPGRLFAGDAGALFVGALLGGVSLLLVQERPDWLLVPPLILLPYLTDVLMTLLWRSGQRKKLFHAHRDHAYQIAIKAGLRHSTVSIIHAVYAFNAAAIGVAAALVGGRVPALAFLALAAASIWLHLRVRKLGVKAGLVGAGIA